MASNNIPSSCIEEALQAPNASRGMAERCQMGVTRVGIPSHKICPPGLAGGQTGVRSPDKPIRRVQRMSRRGGTERGRDGVGGSQRALG